MSDNKNKKLFLGLLALFVFIGVGFFLSLGPLSAPDVADAVKENVEGQDTAALPETVSQDASAAFDLGFAKTERVLGDPSAPIKISEHSSLTCGHCGNFHNNTYPAFKKAYIDTGKAYLVFSDFPLNAPALHASMTARCLPQDRDYFAFIQELFETQREWAYEADYLLKLQKKVETHGLDKTSFERCIQNKDLQASILKRIQGAQAQWEISSTPSFVVNNQVVISGAQSFEDFDNAIQQALKDIEAQNSNEGE